jgi:hypothetical protein
MNDEQRKIFSLILDKNWDATQEKDLMKKFNLMKELGQLKDQLKTSMGTDAYNRWMENGKKMFAPKS